MAQPASNPKIEELRFKVRTDPKSRLFFPLAEELRKVNQFGEAEQVLRTGLTNHPTYLSGWVSLGRVLREQKKDRDAVDAFAKALQLDPGNVVAARHLAEAYYAVGEKVESIKKYKLVHALMPSDQEVEAMIEQLERELNPITPSPFAMADESPAKSAAPTSAALAPQPPAAPEPPPLAAPDLAPFPESDRVFDDTASSLLRAQMQEIRTGDLEPMSAAHSESPFEEPAADAGYSSSAFEVEQPEGMHIARAPLAADLPEGWADPVPVESAPAMSPVPLEMPPADEADVFAPAERPASAGAGGEEVTNTLTMADLYTRQGLHDEARRIYDAILEREPQNASVRAKRDALSAPSANASSSRDPKVDKLERWLKKVARKEAGGV
jgi:tetratricopeptide (TPR) repeat protein